VPNERETIASDRRCLPSASHATCVSMFGDRSKDEQNPSSTRPRGADLATIAASRAGAAREAAFPSTAPCRDQARRQSQSPAAQRGSRGGANGRIRPRGGTRLRHLSRLCEREGENAHLVYLGAVLIAATANMLMFQALDLYRGQALDQRGPPRPPRRDRGRRSRGGGADQGRRSLQGNRRSCCPSCESSRRKVERIEKCSLQKGYNSYYFT
jgi:hypothetical protein